MFLLNRFILGLLLINFISHTLTIASTTWELVASDNTLHIDNNQMLTLANQSGVIYPLITRHLEAGKSLNLESLVTIALQGDTQIPLETIQLRSGPITTQHLQILIDIIPLLARDISLANKQQEIDQFINSKILFPGADNYLAVIEKIIVLLEIANALDINNLYNICINLLKNYLTRNHFLQMFADNNVLLEQLNIHLLLPELLHTLLNSIISDPSLFAQIVHIIPQSCWLIQTLTGYTRSPNNIVFNPSGNILISSSSDGAIKLWNVIDGRLIRTLFPHITFGTPYPVLYVSISPDGNILASTSSDKTIKLLDIEGNLLFKLTGNRGIAWCVIFSPTGKQLASCSEDNIIQVWDVADGTLLRTLTGHTGIVKHIAFSPDGTLLASVSYDKSVKIWKVADGTLLHTLIGHTHESDAVAFSPNNTILASAAGEEDGKIILWNSRKGHPLRTLTDTIPVESIAFSPDGNIIAAGLYDGSTRLWNVADGTLLYTLTAHTARVASVAFSTDGNMLASGSWDNTVKLWKTPAFFTQRLRNLTLDQILLLLAKANNISHFTEQQQNNFKSVLKELCSKQESFLKQTEQKSVVEQVFQWLSSIVKKRSHYK